MAATGFTIVGEKALQKRLDRLSKKGTRNRIARPAIREASAEIRKRAKAKAPKDSGQLKRSIKNTVRTGRVGVYAVVGPAHGFKIEHEGKPRDPTKYAHLVEFGTSHSAPRPFLRSAYDGTPSMEIIRRRMGEELDKQAKREAAKK